jgi:hypothetical protein
MRFGELTVLKRVESRIYGTKTVVMWRCCCTCGKETTVAGVNLRNENTKSCGSCSYSADRRWKNGRSWKWGHRLPPGRITRNATLKNYQRAARLRNLAWELSEETFDKLTSEPCCYCGAPPANRRQQTGDPAPFVYNGIDRLRNEDGYTESNAVSCCRICNRAKSDLPFADWLAYLIRVKTYTLTLATTR